MKPKKRKKIYKWMLDFIKEDRKDELEIAKEAGEDTVASYGLCFVARKAARELGVKFTGTNVMHHLPELMNQKPETKEAYWWPDAGKVQKVFTPREKALKKAIEEVKQLIE